MLAIVRGPTCANCRLESKLDTALHMLYSPWFTLIHTCVGACFLDSQLGTNLVHYVSDFLCLRAVLPLRLASVCAPCALKRAEFAVRLLPDAMPAALCAHCVQAAEFSAALEADPRMLRVWRVKLHPVVALGLRDQWGYSTWCH
ncbi:hypothetical protein JKP88DRAFT_249125 [Tribonema minus]|uniref:Uncharacterized protein n=1 Tax=Tribonema minus TaxID=303371 RepID=A0A835YUP7_9STRA|nr:hypothetical protein JKP88DRAFT_249125 [Tribonema minus]